MSDPSVPSNFVLNGEYGWFLRRMREPGEPIQKSDLLRHDGSLEELIAKVSAKGGVITVVDEDCLFCRIDGKSYTAKRHAYYTRIPVPGEAPEVDLT